MSRDAAIQSVMYLDLSQPCLSVMVHVANVENLFGIKLFSIQIKQFSNFSAHCARNLLMDHRMLFINCIAKMPAVYYVSETRFYNIVFLSFIF